MYSSDPRTSQNCNIWKQEWYTSSCRELCVVTFPFSGDEYGPSGTSQVILPGQCPEDQTQHPLVWISSVSQNYLIYMQRQVRIPSFNSYTVSLLIIITIKVICLTLSTITFGSFPIIMFSWRIIELFGRCVHVTAVTRTRINCEGRNQILAQKSSKLINNVCTCQGRNANGSANI